MKKTLTRIIDKGYSAFCSVKYGLGNLFTYASVIWRDRDWDYSCMLDLWSLKFNRMSRLHSQYGHHPGSQRTARQLRVCSILCSRIANDAYIDVPYTAHDKKWGQAKHVSLRKNSYSSELREVRLNVKTDQDAEQEREEFRRIYKHAEKQQRDDIRYLLRVIDKHLLTWWD